MEEERAATLIHEHYPLFLPHPFGSKVDVWLQSSTFVRDTHAPMLPNVFIPAADSRDETSEAALLG